MMNNMPGGVPDYDQFMRMNPGQRKNLLRVLGWMSGKQIQPLLMVVFEQDPDPDIRQMAREMLEKQGVHVRVEGGEGLDDVRREERPSPLDEAQARPSIGLPVTDDLSRRAAEALRRGQGTPKPDPRPASDQSVAGSGATVYYTNAAGTFESPFSGPDSVEGGTGRPVQRNQTFPAVFTLIKGNEKYLRGESERPSSTSLVSLAITIGFMLVIIGVMATTTFSVAGIEADSPFLLFIGIFVLVMGIMVVATVREIQRMNRLAANGVVLVGQIVQIYGRWVSSGSGKSRSRSYKVTAQCRVKLPDGRIFSAQGTATRGDLRNAVLPNPGSPIAILYVSDQDYMVL
ncbi:MAG: DUF308 domain-containing protein [Anaerolineae bacterium]|jgi:uncharacterized membrane protein|nr:DUF308 domain-containing protein [Anaerolineae bacterium]